jgi:hypothetical protein
VSKEIVGEEREAEGPQAGDDLFGQENIHVKISPEQARIILQRHGLDVNQQQAEAILSFLRWLAILSLSQTLKK